MNNNWTDFNDAQGILNGIFRFKWVDVAGCHDIPSQFL